MDWYAPIARHLVVPLLDRHDGYRPGRFVRETAAWERLSPAEVAERQWRRVEAVVRHAATTSPYYRRLFAEHGLRPDDIDSPAALARLPVLTKDLVRAHKEEIRSEAFARADLLPGNTGGTTGLPLTFYRDRECCDRRMAAHIVFDRWYGYRVGDRIASAWGARQDIAQPRRLRARLRHALENSPRMLNAASLTPADLADFARSLRQSPVRLLRGYPSVLDMLAMHVSEHGPRLDVRAIVSTAEPLAADVRQRITEFLGCEAFDEYATRECGLVATECERHQGLHVNASGVFVEVVVGDRPARPGETGRIVITDLNSYGFPLLRYGIDDLGRWAEGDCPCGRPFPRLAAVEGRAAQLLYSTDGRLVSSLLITVAFAEMNLPAQAQLVQEAIGEVTVRLVPRPEFTADHRAAIEAIVRRWLGDDMMVTVERVPEIERAPSGKYLFSINRVREPEPVEVAR
jgi:phenylacetate-CoA ligase